MSRFSQYTKNIGALVGQSFIQRTLGMVTTMVLARALGSASFGAYSIVVNTANSAYGFVRLGVDASIHVHTAGGYVDDDGRCKTGELLAAGFLLLLLAGIVGGLGCLVLADWLSENIYGKPELAIWIRVGGIVVFLQCVSQFCYAAMAGLHRFTAYARIMVASAVINVVAITGGVLLAGLIGVVVAMISVQFITVVWLALGVKTGLRIESLQLTLRNFSSRVGQLLKFGFPFYAAGLISIPVIYYLQGLLVRHAGLEALGYLRVIMALAMIVSFIPTSASAAMVSMFVRTKSKDESALAEKIMRNVKMILLFALIIAAMVTIILPWLIPILFGQEYVAVIGAAGLAMVTAVMTAVVGVIGNALFSAKRVDLIFLTTLMQMTVFYVTGIILIPKYGLIGFLVAELLGCLALLVVASWRSIYWFRENAVQVTWMGKVLVPLFLLGAYSIKQVSYNGEPSISDSIIAITVLLLACIWGYTAILDNTERNVIRCWIGLNN